MNKIATLLCAAALAASFTAAARMPNAFGLGGNVTYTTLDDSDKLPALVGGNAKAKSAAGGSLMGHLSLGDEGFLRHFATELAVDFSRHDVTAEKTTLGTLKAGKVRLLIASWSLLWMMMPEWNVCPYVGAGVSYVNLKNAGTGDLSTIKYKSKAGGLAQAGVKYYPSDVWSIDLDVKKIGFRSKAKPKVKFTAGGVPGEVDWAMNPLIVGLGATFYFE